MRVALVQLPLQSHDYAYSLENVPLASGYLASRLARCGAAKIHVEICPMEVANLGGDAAIEEWIVQTRPDVVGMSCSVWNVERSLHICARTARRLGGVTFVMGGPEVAVDNHLLLRHEAFSLGVTGEGEDTFLELVESLREGAEVPGGIPGLLAKREGRIQWTGPRPLVGRLDDIASPYLSGLLQVSFAGTMLMETLRGCPMRCTYCHYHKSAPFVRAFSLERVAREVAWGRERGVGEITLVDPCFAKRPGVLELLEAVVREGSDELALSLELNAEDVSPGLVDALAKARLVHVEVGLQSVNEATLATVGRKFDRDAFTRGVRALRSARAKVTTDVMVGLPGDGPGDVMRAVRFVLDNGLCDELAMHPLCVLPGTVLRSQAEALGIEYMEDPPYLLTRTPTMSAADVREVISWCEDALCTDLFPVEMPLMAGGAPVRGDRRGCFVQRIVLAGAGEGVTCEPSRIGQALCIELREAAWLEREDLSCSLKTLLSENPYTLVSWIVPERLFVPGKTLERIKALSHRAPHPIDRDYMSTYTPVRSLQVFLEVETRPGGPSYVMVPLERDPSRPLWAGLPRDAGGDEEERVQGIVSSLVGEGLTVRFHDLEPREPGPIAERLCTLVVG
ncbi:MAG TPA: B12-binding domain-containing radical SAM protein [Deltaproteobacteria bacterium]|nr:B12-binding domain-containing radical SAM protein [Deltaproteobacteria bacterium]HPP80343.1 B12-binding domain-containing radical SAM protein [Deltaproteobacteria bacterium]